MDNDDRFVVSSDGNEWHEFHSDFFSALIAAKSRSIQENTTHYVSVRNGDTSTYYRLVYVTPLDRIEFTSGVWVA